MSNNISNNVSFENTSGKKRKRPLGPITGEVVYHSEKSMDVLTFPPVSVREKERKIEKKRKR